MTLDTFCKILEDYSMELITIGGFICVCVGLYDLVKGGNNDEC